jgi:hypothetical protein
MNGASQNIPVTVPVLPCVTEPHLYVGVVTVGFTLTLSSTLIVWVISAAKQQQPDTVKPVKKGHPKNRLQYKRRFIRGGLISGRK